MQKQTIKFDLAEFEPITEEFEEDYEAVKRDRFAKVKIKLFGDGENAHTEPVEFEALKKSADSAYDIPLIAELNPYRNNEDFGGHGILTGKEFSFGFVKESEDNPIVFEKDQNGKTFITLYGLIWKKYFANIVDIIKNNDNKVEVSVELDIVKGGKSLRGKPVMKQFVLNAITFLGKITTAACQGAEAELCFSADSNQEFFQDKVMYYKQHFSQDIEIDNSKEVAIDGKWTNPRQKLLTPILQASNEKTLLNEAYLFVDDKGEEGISLSDVSYPHHIIRDNKLVLHIKGVQAAFSRLAQQQKVEGQAKAHLLRHYKELGLNTENFSEFGLTEEQFTMYFAESYGKEENVSMENENVEVIQEEQENTVVEEEASVKEECTETIEEAEEVTEETTETTEEMAKEEETETEEEENSEDGEEQMSSDDGIAPEKPLETAGEVTVAELLERLEKLSTENEQLKADNEAFLSKIESMSDYEELKNFKEVTEARIAQEQEMSKMSSVFSAMEEKGISMSEETKAELINSREQFANIDAWSNYVKAYAFDNCEKDSDGVVSFATLIKKEVNEEDTKLGVWSLLRKNN